jgi:RNA polymerase sigma-70 factor (ECF subfamily)
LNVNENASENGGTSVPEEGDTGGPVARIPAEERRITAMVTAHFDFVWRSLRRRGLPAHAADDATQRVFLVAARRLADIREGAERAFLFHTAQRVGSEASRGFAARKDHPDDDADEIGQVADPSPSPEEQLGRARALRLLDSVLSELPDDLRAVLVLFELEEMSTAAIAELLSIPVGTAASRLRRAREEFHAAVKRLRAREQFGGRIR